jgi:hypothetical protein
MPVAFTKFVAERKMPLTRFVDITSANAARILGLYPQKGAIQPGSDADLVLIDPAVRKTIALADLHADADYSIWEGFACQGYPVTTILRGKVIVEHGKLVGSSSDGRWVERRVSGDVLSRPAVCEQRPVLSRVTRGHYWPMRKRRASASPGAAPLDERPPTLHPGITQAVAPNESQSGPIRQKLHFTRRCLGRLGSSVDLERAHNPLY